MDADLDLLERKLTLLIAELDALRDAKAALERDLSHALAQNRDLAQRMRTASQRLDALLERLPEA